MSDFVELNTLFNSFLFSMLLKSLLEYLLAIMITSVFSHSTFGLVHHVFFSPVPEVQKRRKCLLPGASRNNLKMLLLAVHLAQMDTHIKSFLCKSDAQPHFESAQSLHISAFCWMLRPSSPLQSVPIRHYVVICRLEHRGPILGSLMNDRIIQHLEDTCNIFRKSVKPFWGSEILAHRTLVYG